MKDANRDVVAASGGMISLVFIVLGWLIYGSGPTVADSPDTILDFFLNSHDEVIWSMFVQGLGVLAMIWFMAALTTFLRDAGETVMADAAFISFGCIGTRFYRDDNAQRNCLYQRSRSHS